MAVDVFRELSNFKRELLGTCCAGGKPLNVQVAYELYGEEPVTIRVKSLEGERFRNGADKLAVTEVIPPSSDINSVRFRSYSGKDGDRLPPGDFAYYYDKPLGNYREQLRIIIREQRES